MIKNLKGLISALFLCMSLVACAGTPPLVEKATAEVAYDYAKKNRALKYRPKFFRAGVIYLKKADRFFEERIYNKAKTAYTMARRYFEKAEMDSRIEQIKNGGEF